MGSKQRRFFGALLIVLISGFWIWVTRKNTREDFIYLYAGSALYHQGKNPYNLAAFQSEISSLLGFPNPYPSRFFASGNPPADFFLFWPLARISYFAAFYFWCAVIFISLIVIAFSGISILGLDIQEPISWLTIAATLFFPGLIHSVFYHRLALPALAVFLLGLVFWEKDRRDLAALLWSFLALFPQWFFCVAVFLILRRQFRAFLISAWLFIAQIIPYILGWHPWLEWGDFSSSLVRYGNQFVFFDDQSLGVGIYKLVFLKKFLSASVLHPLFFPPENLKTLRAICEFSSGIFILWISVQPISFVLGLSGVLCVALLGSLYSHCGDQVWILPFLLCAFRKESRENLFWILFIFFMLNVTLIPDYYARDPHLWFWSGFWSVGYLALVGAYWTLVMINSSSGSREMV